MLRTDPLIEVCKSLAARESTDGSPTEIPVYVARPQGSSHERRPGLLLMQEIFGVNSHIQDVAQRFAAAGYVVVAPDIFYRSGHWLSFGYDQFQDVRPIVATLSEEMVIDDMRAALRFLVAQPDVDPERIGVTGYCFGGRASLLAAITFCDLIRAAAIYYGGGIVTNQPSAPVSRVGAIRCPVIAFFGALDKHIPQEQVQALEAALTGAGVRNEVYSYPYADHGFFCDARATYHPRAAQDAWQRTLRFFDAHLGPVTEAAWQSYTVR